MTVTVWPTSDAGSVRPAGSGTVSDWPWTSSVTEPAATALIVACTEIELPATWPDLVLVVLLELAVRIDDVCRDDRAGRRAGVVAGAVGEPAADAVRDRDQMTVAREEQRRPDAADDDAADRARASRGRRRWRVPESTTREPIARVPRDSAKRTGRRRDEQRAVLLRDDDALEGVAALPAAGQKAAVAAASASNPR